MPDLPVGPVSYSLSQTVSNLRSRDHAVTGFDDPLVPTPHHLDTSRERCAVSSKESLRNMLMRFRQNIPRGECRSYGNTLARQSA